jgi:hypothetical protein
MHAFPAEVSGEHYYYKDGRLSTVHQAGSVCLVAPGEAAWKSDLRALELLSAGKSSSCPLEAVAAKYLINELHESY